MGNKAFGSDFGCWNETNVLPAEQTHRLELARAWLLLRACFGF